MEALEELPFLKMS